MTKLRTALARVAGEQTPLVLETMPKYFGVDVDGDSVTVRKSNKASMDDRNWFFTGTLERDGTSYTLFVTIFNESSDSHLANKITCSMLDNEGRHLKKRGATSIVNMTVTSFKNYIGAEFQDLIKQIKREEQKDRVELLERMREAIVARGFHGGQAIGGAFSVGFIFSDASNNKFSLEYRFSPYDRSGTNGFRARSLDTAPFKISLVRPTGQPLGIPDDVDSMQSFIEEIVEMFFSVYASQLRGTTAALAVIAACKGVKVISRVQSEVVGLQPIREVKLPRNIRVGSYQYNGANRLADDRVYICVLGAIWLILTITDVGPENCIDAYDIAFDSGSVGYSSRTTIKKIDEHSLEKILREHTNKFVARFNADLPKQHHMAEARTQHQVNSVLHEIDDLPSVIKVGSLTFKRNEEIGIERHEHTHWCFYNDTTNAWSLHIHFWPERHDFDLQVIWLKNERVIGHVGFPIPTKLADLASKIAEYVIKPTTARVALEEGIKTPEDLPKRIVLKRRAYDFVALNPEHKSAYQRGLKARWVCKETGGSIRWVYNQIEVREFKFNKVPQITLNVKRTLIPNVAVLIYELERMPWRG